MASVSTTAAAARPLGAFFDFSKVSKAIADLRQYRRTLAELNTMTDRELADLGISRLSIRDIAREAVYGA